MYQDELLEKISDDIDLYEDLFVVACLYKLRGLLAQTEVIGTVLLMWHEEWNHLQVVPAIDLELFDLRLKKGDFMAEEVPLHSCIATVSAVFARAAVIACIIVVITVAVVAGPHTSIGIAAAVPGVAEVLK